MKTVLNTSIKALTRLNLVLGILTFTMLTPTVFAEHDERDNRYAGEYTSSSTQTKYVYADVVDVDPIVRFVTVSRPERVCQQVEYRNDHRGRRHDSAGGTIAGGLLGGVIGRQFGGGKGRDAATIAGVLIGSAIGHDSEANNTRRSRGRDYETRTREHCETRYERHEEERIDGYNVTYIFQGETYTTRTEYEPGEKIRLAVNARPVPEYDRGRRSSTSTNEQNDRYRDYDNDN